ncbi:biotin/lipoyl-binding protein [Frateuria defendens]|uniref:biotin/lipoyl-binding protein n=1 Tax=Frateuria defendens TaxID=2219559 RepID=UPI00066FB74E|nr:HlyD family secretion protein [Frateuria defendens]
MNVQSLLRFLITATVVVIAVLIGHAMWRHYLYAPWTRDGRVRAEVVKVAPDVSGLVTRVAVEDNQVVHKGDLLFVIDQERFANDLAQAEANLAAAEASARAAGANINAALASAAAREADYEKAAGQATRRQRIGDVISQEEREDAEAAANAAHATMQQAQASGRQAGASRQQAEAAVAQAKVAVDRARLDLARTEVRASVDGYVTNLDVRVGDYAPAGAARLALIDSHSYYIYGYFEETKLPQLGIGDPVDIRLMSGAKLRGRITGIARGIADGENPTGADLLIQANPTFHWVRLAQRVPVRVAIDTEHLPADVVLAAGMTATVKVLALRKPGA